MDPRLPASDVGLREIGRNTMIPWLTGDVDFPPIDCALREPNGLLAAGGDLSTSRLVHAYRNGIFPWYCEGQPVLWWSPDPRMVLDVSNFRISRSLQKRIRQSIFEVRCDTVFREVVEACASVARSGQYGTWITPAMINAYTALHEAGYSHSIETWLEGRLVGGLYGIALGRAFFGESMFALESDASKVALAALVRLLARQNVSMIDCQQETDHLASFGARTIPRQIFAERLSDLIDSEDPPAGWPRGPIDPS